MAALIVFSLVEATLTKPSMNEVPCKWLQSMPASGFFRGPLQDCRSMFISILTPVVKKRQSSILCIDWFTMSQIQKWRTLSSERLWWRIFSNIEQQSLEFVKYTLEPWIVRWEQSINRALLSETEKPTKSRPVWVVPSYPISWMQKLGWMHIRPSIWILPMKFWQDLQRYL